MLSQEQKEKIRKFVFSVKIDVEDLESYEYDDNPYGLEYPLSRGSGCCSWDEDEELEAKKERAIELITKDGIWEHISLGVDCDTDDAEYEKVYREVVEFIRSI